MLALPFLTFGQSKINVLQPDSRLFEAYDSAYILTLMDKNPFLIERWNFYLDNSWKVADFSPEKGVSYESITIPDFENINILSLENTLGLKRHHELPSVYRIENTNKILVFCSGKEFIRRFNEHLVKKREG